MCRRLSGTVVLALLVYGSSAAAQAGDPYLRINFVDVGQEVPRPKEPGEE